MARKKKATTKRPIESYEHKVKQRVNNPPVEARINLPLDAIVDFCAKWGIVEFAIFGSVLRDDFRPESDIDVMVQFDTATSYTLFDLTQMEDELRSVFGRDVDLLTKRAVETSRNYLRRDEILKTAEILYALCRGSFA